MSDEFISNDDGGMGMVFPLNTLERRRAGVEEIIEHFGVDESVDELLALAEVVAWRQHSTEPDGCGCDDVGWWCDEGDGPPVQWLWISS